MKVDMPLNKKTKPINWNDVISLYIYIYIFDYPANTFGADTNDNKVISFITWCRIWVIWFTYNLQSFYNQIHVTHCTFFSWISSFRIDCFSDMSTRLGLYYAEKLGNCIHCMFIFRFFVKLFLKSLLYRFIWHQVFLSVVLPT